MQRHCFYRDDAIERAQLSAYVSPSPFIHPLHTHLDMALGLHIIFKRSRLLVRQRFGHILCMSLGSFTVINQHPTHHLTPPPNHHPTTAQPPPDAQHHPTHNICITRTVNIHWNEQMIIINKVTGKQNIMFPKQFGTTSTNPPTHLLADQQQKSSVVMLQSL